MKFVAGFVGGLILAVLGMLLVGIAGASNPGNSSLGPGTFIFFWVVGFVVALTAPAAAKAWRRLLICSAILSFLLPLAGIIFTGSQMAGQLERGGAHAGAAAAGAALGGTLVSGALGFVGFFLGIVFLVIGLLVGRGKQVVYVQVPASPERSQ